MTGPRRFGRLAPATRNGQPAHRLPGAPRQRQAVPNAQWIEHRRTAAARPLWRRLLTALGLFSGRK